MSSSAHALLWLAECAVKSALVLALGLVMVRFMGRYSAAQKHLVLSIACFSALAVPVLQFLLPAQNVFCLAIKPSVCQSSRVNTIHTIQPNEAPTSHVQVPEQQDALRDPPKPQDPAGFARKGEAEALGLASVKSETSTPTSPSRPPGPGWRALPQLVIATWIFISGLLIFNGLRALVAIQRIMKNSSSLPWTQTPAVLQVLEAGRPCELRVSEMARPAVAMTWGIWRSIIMMPCASRLWPSRRFEAVLLHELAHVRRFDGLTQWLSAVLCALYWFNPFAWLCAREMRREAEAAADDCVLRCGIKPSNYAATLVAIASELGGKRHSLASLGVSFMKPSKIESRVKAILDRHHPRKGLSSIEALAAICVAGVLLIPISSMRASAAEPQANTTSQGQAAKLATERKAGGNPQDSGHPVSDLEQAKKRIAELERSNARLQQSLSAAIRELHGQRSNMLRSKLYILDSSARKTAMDRAMKSMKSDHERAVLEQQRAIRQLKAAQDEIQKDAANQQQLKSRMQESIDARKTAQAQLQAAQSQLADKVSQYKRLEELQRQGYVTNFDVRAAQTSLKDAQAQVALSEAYQQQVSRRLEESLKKQFEQQQMHQTLLKLEFRIEELEEHLKKLENLNRAKLTIPPDAPAANLARPYRYPVELTYQLASGG